ncbi:MAG: zinc-dependent metalloprotease, partial [Cyclobacteriaceae bacterium]|nr:zinc-dependent metalloprotease [Cyclobacteriaceae bacterium]
QQEAKALDALIKTVDPSVLALPESLLKIIPPRALGYNRHRELTKIKTELTFDPIAAAESAADLTFSLILHSARANRLIEHHARDPKLAGLQTVIDKLVTATFKSPNKPGLEGAVQMSTNHVLFANLAKLALAKNASGETKAIVLLKLEQLKGWLLNKTTTDEEWRAHYAFIVRQIITMQQNPEEFKGEELLPAPPGMPIGDSDLEFCGN